MKINKICTIEESALRGLAARDSLSRDPDFDWLSPGECTVLDVGGLTTELQTTDSLVSDQTVMRTDLDLVVGGVLVQTCHLHVE